MTARLLALPTALLLALVPSCSDEPEPLGDRASCPGLTCTDDARDRLEALADLERVTGVEEVARSSRLDRGSSSTAVVRAGVTTVEQAREVGVEVLGILASWPDHDAATALATVRSDPPREVAGSARETEVLRREFYAPCSRLECADVLADLVAGLEAEYDGVDVSARVEGRELIVTGTAPRDQAALAARGAVQSLRELGRRVASRAEVRIRWRAPISVTLRLEDGRVCEQPAGVVVSCRDDNSEPFSG